MCCAAVVARGWSYVTRRLPGVTVGNFCPPSALPLLALENGLRSQLWQIASTYTNAGVRLTAVGSVSQLWWTCRVYCRATTSGEPTLEEIGWGHNNSASARSAPQKDVRGLFQRAQVKRCNPVAPESATGPRSEHGMTRPLNDEPGQLLCKLPSPNKLSTNLGLHSSRPSCTLYTPTYTTLHTPTYTFPL